MTGFEICDPGRGFYASGEDGVLPDGRSLELDSLGPEAVLEGRLVGWRRLRLCRALVEGNGESFICLGLHVDAEPGEASLRRSIGVILADGGLLAIAAARPPGAEGHGTEEVVGALVEPDGSEVRFEEALLSTEYDGDGRHRRATVELEGGAGDPPLRGAGFALEGTWVEQGPSRGAFFRWSVEGRSGCGRYEITEP